jgi:hypothetical protein
VSLPAQPTTSPNSKSTINITQFAAEFKKQFADGDTVEISDKEVSLDGNALLEFERLVTNSTVRIVNCHFLPGIRFANTSIEGSLIFEGCHFSSLAFYDLRLGRSLQMTDCEVTGDFRIRGRVGGNIEIMGVTARCGVSLFELKCEGHLQVTDIVFGNDEDVSTNTFSLDLRSSQFESIRARKSHESDPHHSNRGLGVALLGSVRASALAVRSDADLNGWYIQGSVNLERSRLGSLFMIGTHIENSRRHNSGLKLRQANIAGSTVLESLSCQGPFEASNIKVDGDFDFSGARFGAEMDLANAEIGGYLSCSESIVTHEKAKPEIIATVGEFADFSLLRCSGRVDLRHLQLGNVDNTSLDDPQSPLPRQGDLVLRGAKLKGALTLASGQAISRISGRLLVQSATIDTLQFSGLSFERATKAAEVPHSGPKLSPFQWGIVNVLWLLALCSTPFALFGYMLGRLGIVSFGNRPRRSRHLAKDLLQLCSCNTLFRPKGQSCDSNTIIDLERAVVRRLEIIHHVPANLDIEHIEVSHWRLNTVLDTRVHFGSWCMPPWWSNGHPPQCVARMWQWVRQAGAPRSDAVPFLELLANTNSFRRSNYQMVERYLRSEGHDAAAADVYVAMKSRDRSEATGLTKTAIYVVHSFFGYGTAAARPIAVWTCTLLVAFLLVNRPGALAAVQNVAPPSPYPVRAAPVKWLCQKLLDRDQIWIVLSAHLPFIKSIMYSTRFVPQGWAFVWLQFLTVVYGLLVPLIIGAYLPRLFRRNNDSK